MPPHCRALASPRRQLRSRLRQDSKGGATLVSNLALSPAPYSLADGIRTPPSPTHSRVARKWARKCANRAARKALRAPARRAAAPQTVTWADVVASRPSTASPSWQVTPRSSQPSPDPATVPSRPGVPHARAKDAATSSGARRAATTPSLTLAALVNHAMQSSSYPSHAVLDTVLPHSSCCTRCWIFFWS